MSQGLSVSRVPLSVLDLVPVASGSGAAQALRNTVDLARHAERLGYARYWIAEHHLNPGVAGTSPAVVLGAVAAATSAIRVGSGAVLMGHRTALTTVEEFGLLDALHPGRIDLGLGRSGGRPTGASAHLWDTPRFVLQRQLLQLPGAEPQDYDEQVGDVLALLAGTYVSTRSGSEGEEAHVLPGEGAGVELWLMGSGAGESAEVAARRGLRFAAAYHIAPKGALEAAGAYLAAFVPSALTELPWLTVSADVVVAEDEATARELAAGYAPWVRSIRAAEGAIPFPTPAEAAAREWTDAERAMVQDRVDTQLVGSPAQVADGLEQLRERTGADELVITTITHDHADRVRSYELLMREWAGR